MTSYKSFSQTDTTVLLKNDIAKLVIKDLVTFDGLNDKYKITQQQLEALNNKSITFQEIINNLNNQIENKNLIISQKTEQIKNYKLMSSDLKKALIKEQRTKKIYKVFAAIGAGALISNVIK